PSPSAAPASVRALRSSVVSDRPSLVEPLINTPITPCLRNRLYNSGINLKLTLRSSFIGVNGAATNPLIFLLFILLIFYALINKYFNVFTDWNNGLRVIALKTIHSTYCDQRVETVQKVNL